MKGFVAAVAILLLSWDVVFATSPVRPQCPSACRQFIRRVSKRVRALEDAGPTTAGAKWELVYSVKAGTGRMVLDSWVASNDVNANDPNAELFKSPLAEVWGKRPVDQVRVELTTGTEVKAYFIFDGRARGTSKTTFMKEENLMASSNGNLVGKTFNYFDVYGDQRQNRHFYMNGISGGCDTDAGWLIVVDSGDQIACDWMKREARPYFLYCEGDGPCQSSGAPIADTFRILVKFA